MKLNTVCIFTTLLFPYLSMCGDPQIINLRQQQKKIVNLPSELPAEISNQNSGKLLQFPTSQDGCNSTGKSDTTDLILNTRINTIWFEVGFTAINDVEWVSVSTSSSDFRDAVVFVSLPEIPGELASSGYLAIARVRNVMNQGVVSFESKLYQANDSYCLKTWQIPTAIPFQRNAAWMVIESGAFNITTNTFIIGKGPITREDHVVSNQNNFVRFIFPSGCGSPTTICGFGANIPLGVVVQLQTLVYDRLLIPRIMITQRRFTRVILQPHDSIDVSYYSLPDPETLGYLAFATDLTIVCMEGLTFEIHAYTGITSTKRVMQFNYEYNSPPGIFGVLGTSTSVANSASVRIFDRSSSSVSFLIQEDQCRDEDTVHSTPETVYMMAVGDQSSTTSCIRCNVRYSTPPTQAPTLSLQPTLFPTPFPTTVPSLIPTIVPSRVPTVVPSRFPTVVPSRTPTRFPSRSPTRTPSRPPTRPPTSRPSRFPTYIPTLKPSFLTKAPSRQPTFTPSFEPIPTRHPTFFFESPTRVPTIVTKSPSRMSLPTTDYRCYSSETESCNLSDYEFGTNVQIIPPQSSGCGCIESREKYSFVVTKSDPKNVLVYFQGGGVCWDQNSFNTNQCRTYTMSPSEKGILNHTMPSSLNAFANYTTVTVPYCSGDFFLGNATGTYSDSDGNLIRYRGIVNTLFILNWLMNEQQNGGYLATKLDRLILAGSSAGSIGAQVWSDQFIKSIPASFSAVLADSLFTYISPQHEANLFHQWDFCSSILLPEQLLPFCSPQSERHRHLRGSASANFKVKDIDDDNSQGPTPNISFSYSQYFKNFHNISTNSISTSSTNRLRFLDIMSSVMNQQPQTIFIYISSKRDAEALSVYNDFMIFFGEPWINADQYYDINTKNFESLKASLVNDNLILYFISSPSHVYLNRDFMFTTTPYGSQATLSLPVLGIPLYTWLQPFNSNQLNSWPCEELNISNCKPWENLGLTSQCAGTDCSTLLFP